MSILKYNILYINANKGIVKINVCHLTMKYDSVFSISYSIVNHEHLRKIAMEKMYVS